MPENRSSAPAELPKKKKYERATRLALPRRLACTGVDELAGLTIVTLTPVEGLMGVPAQQRYQAFSLRAAMQALLNMY